ncbi:hypothetical protein CPB85DRAFT_1449265 [Mucidula mucida]|nr:hypothetical protein CPB85DRAFT_1449265 [Mucidula mucida]
MMKEEALQTPLKAAPASMFAMTMARLRVEIDGLDLQYRLLTERISTQDRVPTPPRYFYSASAKDRVSLDANVSARLVANERVNNKWPDNTGF